MPDVFAKYSSPYDSLEGVSDISDLASRLHRCIINNSASSYGKRRQDVMRIIQAFHAWGNISQIEKLSLLEQHQQYLDLLATLGRQVRVELTNGAVIIGQAVDLDIDGRLIVVENNDLSTRHIIDTGDVVHLRNSDHD